MMIKQIKQSSKDIICFFAHLILWVFVGTYIGTKLAVFDATQYQVDLPKQFYVNGKFEFFHYPDTLRGYVLPFVSLILRKISSITHIDNYYVVLYFLTFLFALITGFLIPSIAKIVVAKSNKFFISGACFVFMFIFS